MPKKPTLLELLAHPITQDAMRSIADGSDPRGVLAGMAGDFVAQEVARRLGVRHAPAAKASAQGAAPRASRTARARAPEATDDGDVIDAEYTVVDSKPRGAKKAG